VAWGETGPGKAAVGRETEAPQEPAEPSGKKANDRSTIGISGYTHLEELLNTANGQAQLQARRVRLSIEGHSRDRVDGKIQFSYDRNQFLLKDAYMTGYAGDIGVRAGLFKIPFSEESLISSSKRLSLERSPFVKALFPGERDRGAYVHYKPREKRGASFLVGVFSGNGGQAWDNNAAKDVVVRYRQGFDEGNGMLFLGCQLGQFTDNANVTTARRYFGGGAHWVSKSKKWSAHTEAYGGQSLGNPFAAALVRASRSFDGGKHTVYAMYDYWDPDTGAANDRQLGPNVGYIYQMSPDAKITLEFTGRQNEATAGTEGQVGLRMQWEFD